MTDTQVHVRAALPNTLAELPGAIRLPGTESIGMSYDVLSGEYASPSGTRELLFDLGAYEEIDIAAGHFHKPEIVLVQPFERGGIERTEGKTSRDYQRDTASKVRLEGNYGFFSGSLDQQFTANERRCTTYRFVSQTDRFLKYLLRLQPHGTLAERVLPHVRADLDNLPPDTLFSHYGTHYLTNLIIGATATYSSATDTSEYSSSIDIKTALELKYKALTTGSSASLTDNQSKAVKSLSDSSHLQIFVQGGRSELADDILNGSYKTWIESINANMAFVELNDDSLQPLWTLCSGPRRAELETAYQAFAARHPAEGVPDIIRIHHFATSVTKSRHYHSQHPDDFPDKDWFLADTQFKFYAFASPGEGRVPIYIHRSLKSDPKRFKLSTMQQIGHGWADSTQVAFYAYPERGDKRRAVFGYVSNADSAHHGWLYTTDASVPQWSRMEIAFYVPDLG